MIPSFDTCFMLMRRYGMLQNIVSHSIVVAGIAHRISTSLNTAGIHVSVARATAGALLHDIGKTQSLGTDMDHADLGRRICLHHRFDEIADLVGEHIFLKDPDLNGTYTENEIVYYADKRVNHDRIVSLDERLEYIIKKYGENKPRLTKGIIRNFALCARVERKLFRPLTIRPESLSELIRPGSLFTKGYSR